MIPKLFKKPGYVPVSPKEAAIRAELAEKAETAYHERKRAMAYDKGKRRFTLMPAAWSRILVDVFEAGAKKYAPDNWMQSVGTDEHDQFMEKRLNSLMRHLDDYRRGVRIDPETGMHVLALVAWNAMAVLHYEINDTRPAPGTVVKVETRLV